MSTPSKIVVDNNNDVIRTYAGKDPHKLGYIEMRRRGSTWKFAPIVDGRLIDSDVARYMEGRRYPDRNAIVHELQSLPRRLP